MARFSMKSIYLVLIFIIITGFALRFAYLDRSIRFDEAQTVYVYATKSIPSIFADYSAPNNHIFHTIFVHFSFKYLGESPIFVRLPSFIAGLLLIPMSFAVGKRFYNPTTGLLSASLVAIHPIMIDFSVNARGYTFIALITLCLFYIGHDLQREDNTQKWLLVSLLSALGFLTVPVMLYPMGIFALWLLVSIIHYNDGQQRNDLLKNYVVSMLLGAILTIIFYTPAIYLSGLDSIINNVNIQAMGLNEFYSQIPTVLGRMWLHISWKMPLIVVVPLILTFIVGIICHRKLSSTTLLLVPFMLVWIVPLLLLQRVDPFPRVWHFLVPLLLIISSAGIAYILERLRINQPLFLGSGLVLLSLGMSAYIAQSEIIPNSTFTLRVPDSERVAFFLNDIMTPNDVIIMRVPSSYTVLYYSLIHDLSLGDTANNENSDSPEIIDDSPAYIYIVYHHNGELADLYNSFAEEIDNSEIIQEWDYGVVRRGIQQTD
ncbi:MAG: hypothetical protein Phog2KO_44240 [Phototrophicaceae bacterium]